MAMTALKMLNVSMISLTHSLLLMAKETKQKRKNSKREEHYEIE
jgi:hypothetical protein